MQDMIDVHYACGIALDTLLVCEWLAVSLVHIQKNVDALANQFLAFCRFRKFLQSGYFLVREDDEILLSISLCRLNIDYILQTNNLRY